MQLDAILKDAKLDYWNYSELDSFCTTLLSMKIHIHTRNADLAEDFRTITEEKLNSMERFNIVIERVEVEILHEANPRQGKNSHRVILTSHGSGPLIRAEAAEFNDVAAFDMAIKAFALQIRKIHERTNDFDRDTLRKRKDVV